MNNEDLSLQKLWDKFLQEWPISRLEAMTLEEYTRAGSADTFTYWLEFKLDRLGSMKGGNSQKYGIYSRKDKSAKERELGRIYDDEYGWLQKYGESREEAFKAVKQLVVETVRAAIIGDLEAIEEIDLGPTYKWKIAFHYQNQRQPKIVAVFKTEIIERFLELNQSFSMRKLQEMVFHKKNPEESLLDFSRRIWSFSRGEFRFWKVSHGHSVSDEDKGYYLSHKLIAIHKDTAKGQASSFSTQSEEFGNKLLIGDYFYLCHGNQFGPMLIGRVTSSAAISEKNPEYFVREYEVVSEASSEKPYEGEKRGWTPNYNSTLGRVPENEAKLFEEWILKPYFDLSLNSFAYQDAFEKEPKVIEQSKGPQHFWLTANPGIWDPRSYSVGDEQSYTLYNENGRKRRIFSYFCEASPGDKILIYMSSPIRKICGEAVVTRAVDNPESKDARLYFRIVNHFENGATRDEMLGDQALEECEPLVGNGQGSIFKLTSSEYKAITEGFADSDTYSEAPSNEDQKISIEEILSGVYIDQNEFEKILFAIRNKKNLILQGPPGSGKSYLAKRLAMALTEDRTFSRVTWVQFHQSFTYEDFIRGYKPSNNGGFKLQDGVFLRACRMAATSPHMHVVVIDEMNRGNVSKIFGEMLYLLEADKRDSKSAISLAYRPIADQGEKFWIPDNLLIIGLANTADRSLVPIDQALRRRFAFYDCNPRFTHPAFMKQLIEGGFPEDRVKSLIALLEEINQTIVAKRDLGPGYEIGHSYFCLPETRPFDIEDWIKNVINSEVSHLLKEHFIDKKAQADHFIERLLLI